MKLIFFFNDTATTEIYTLSLHDALPILVGERLGEVADGWAWVGVVPNLSSAGMIVDCVDGPQPEEGRAVRSHEIDRKSTRLNSSHANISYAVFCLKKKQKDSC